MPHSLAQIHCSHWDLGGFRGGCGEEGLIYARQAPRRRCSCPGLAVCYQRLQRGEGRAEALAATQAEFRRHSNPESRAMSSIGVPSSSQATGGRSRWGMEGAATALLVIQAAVQAGGWIERAGAACSWLARACKSGVEIRVATDAE